MADSQHRDNRDRRSETRIDSTLSLHFQRISPLEVKKDPYDPRFELPRYFTLAAELSQVDSVQRSQLALLARENPLVGGLIEAMNLKLELLAEALQDSLARLLSPVPQQVNLSEGGLSFHAHEPMMPGTHLHLALSNSVQGYHIAATARVVYCEDEDLEGFRTGIAFINIHPQDRAVLARDILRKHQENQALEAFRNPETN